MSSSEAAIPAEPGPRRAVGLWAALVALAAIAAALVVTSVLSYRRAHAVEASLGKAATERVMRSVAARLRGGRELDAALRLILDDERDAGLRWIGVFERDGRVRAEAGVSAAPATLAAHFLDPATPRIRRVGDRWRLMSPPPLVPGGARRGPPGDPELGPPDRDGPPEPGAPPDRFGPPDGPPGRRPPPYAIEVAPLAAVALVDEARRTLLAGLASALALLLAAAFIARWARQRARLEARIAHGQRLASLGEMSAVLAHEIRNPLAALKGHAQLLVEDLADRAPERRTAARVVDGAIRLERITNDLLEFARTGRIERAPCDPAAVAKDVVATLDDPRLEVDATGAPPSWRLDAGRMAQVLTNLCSNALQAAPTGAVTVAVTGERGALVYRVRDRGPGLPSGDVAALFEPFHTTRVKGTGLGLAVARRLVELHGGTLDGRDHPDGGAELTARIPAGGR